MKETSTGRRRQLYESNKNRLETLAYKFKDKTMMDLNEFVVVVIDVDDPTWRGLVNSLMPDCDWNKIREEGGSPVARGSVGVEIIDDICSIMPRARHILKSGVQEGAVMGIVLAGRWISVYDVIPNPHLELN